MTEAEPDPITPSSRRLRADARSNRARILNAAQEAFGRSGESASTKEIARLAGVGSGTVFRHFANKSALLEAVRIARFQQLTEQAAALAESGDPAEAFFAFFETVVSQASTKVVADALVSVSDDIHAGPAETPSQNLRRAIDTLLSASKSTGAVRPDAGLPEVYALLVGSSAVPPTPTSTTVPRAELSRSSLMAYASANIRHPDRGGQA